MRIAYTRPDGGVSVVVSGPMLDGETEADFRVRVYAQSIPPDATNVSEMDIVDADREFRDAWELTNNKIVVSLPKAREIQKQRIEAARQDAMREALLQEALGENVTSKKAQIAAIRADQIVASAKDIAALKASKPEVLKKG